MPGDVCARFVLAMARACLANANKKVVALDALQKKSVEEVKQSQQEKKMIQEEANEAKQEAEALRQETNDIKQQLEQLREDMAEVQHQSPSPSGSKHQYSCARISNLASIACLQPCVNAVFA